MAKLRPMILVLAAFALATASAACSGEASNTPGESETPTASGKASATTPAPPPETTGGPTEFTRAEQTMPRNGGGGQEQTDAEGGRVPLAGDEASLVPPEGFRRLTPQQIATKYPSVSPPQDVFANGSGSVSVAITLSQARLSPGQLEEHKQYLEQALPELTPGLRWIERDFEDIGGRRWIHLEFTSRAVDTDIHNDMYITSSGDRPLQLNFNSTTGQYGRWEVRLEESKDSIYVRE